MLNRIFTGIFCMFFLAPAWAGALKITHAYIPDAPPVVKMMAAYMTITNTSDKTVTIHDFTGDNFGAIELHETTMKDGMMGMSQLPELVIQPHASVELKPGGKHLMLMGRKKNLSINDQTSITLHSDQGKDTVQLTVKQAGSASSQHHHHAH